jgi:gluconate 2-dehydrogenase gamma chain
MHNVPATQLRGSRLETTRRTFLSQGASAIGLVLVSSLTPELMAQAHQHVKEIARDGNPHTFRFLTPQEAADLDAFAAQIVPSDETPGAREAGAVYFADYVMSSINPEQQADFRKALALLRIAAAQQQRGAASFAALPVEEQIVVMKRMEKPPEGNAVAAMNSVAAEAGSGTTSGTTGVEAFGALRFMVLAGTFCDPSLGGNQFQIGWKLLGFNDQSYWAPPFGYYDAHAEEKA